MVTPSAIFSVIYAKKERVCLLNLFLKMLMYWNEWFKWSKDHCCRSTTSLCIRELSAAAGAGAAQTARWKLPLLTACALLQSERGYCENIWVSQTLQIREGLEEPKVLAITKIYIKNNKVNPTQTQPLSNLPQYSTESFQPSFGSHCFLKGSSAWTGGGNAL